jgi:von Willebrand factor type A domain-containing protein
MRGKRCAKLSLMLLPAALFGAGVAAAETSPSPATEPSLPVIVVLDASSSMNGKIGGASKIASVRTELGQAVAAYSDRLSFGLVAFGHRKASNCADSEILAKPGEFTAATQSDLLGKIKPKGQAPIAAALSDAARGAQDRVDIVLIADGGDNCDPDMCSAAAAMKQKAPGLRVNVIGFGEKEEEIKPLSCLAEATGGNFLAATKASDLKQALSTLLDAIVSQPQTSPQPVAAVNDGATPAATAASPPGPAASQPIDPGAAQSAPAGPQQQVAAPASQTAPGQGAGGAGETAVYKSSSLPPGETAAIPPAPKPSSQSSSAQIQLPVSVTLKALVSEGGPRLQSGLTWRVYESKPSPEDGGYKLLSTHHEAMPTAALLPGEYLVNAAYGLSNLTKKIKVESGRSIEETFVLNTGGIKLAGVLPSGEPVPDSAARYDILSDEEDQSGNRQTVLGNAKPGVVIRLNAGAYRIECLYGDANATVKGDVTVEPGKITEVTLKQTGSKTTFKLVQSLGGEALADTKWTILTSAGDVVKENAGALPTHILAPGSYAVIANHAGESYTRKFSIESGEAKQVEVVVDDGPTSAEDLKTLTDPPEPPPPPSGGTVAGDGQTPSPAAGIGFDGAPKQADPNAPLINPGALLRPGR